jgi:purine-binding chemotaxis protein CheW
MSRLHSTLDAASAEERKLLLERAESARAVARAAKEETLVWLAEFPIGSESYAVPLERLLASVPLRSVTPVLQGPAHLLGVLGFQGRVLAALSLASMLGVRGWRSDPAVLLVVEDESGHALAIDCEQVPQPIAIPASSIDEARAKDPGPVVAVPMGVDRVVHVIDVAALVSRSRQEARDEQR